MDNKIAVFGIFVVDLMARGPHLPTPAETVKGNFFSMNAGGKGFNQGMAAHKAGGNVRLITKLGRDRFASVALDAMEEVGLSQESIFYSETEHTGMALVCVDENTSQNQIMIVPGASNKLTDAELNAAEEIIADSDYFLTQLEADLSDTERLINYAYSKNVKVILNTAPALPISDALLKKAALVTPNEVEAEALTGVKVTDEASARQAASILFQKGVKGVVITMGGKGVYIDTGDKQILYPAPKVDVVDTTGAGDAFNGGLVTALAQGQELWEAGKFANALAALSVQRMGAAPSLPTRAEVLDFLNAMERQ